MPGAIVEEEKSQIESIKEQLKLEKEDDVVVEDVKDGKEEERCQEQLWRKRNLRLNPSKSN
jgi:methyl coenzyme M reductase beta subunit